jgi:predicted acylesterase/phospholipase RssA
MRGCVSAGMVTALWYLGLDDSIDVIYGSSAGSLIGAYFITKQLPYQGPEIYYKWLTDAAAEGRFIDKSSILRACGLGLFDLRLPNILSMFNDRY